MTQRPSTRTTPNPVTVVIPETPMKGTHMSTHTEHTVAGVERPGTIKFAVAMMITGAVLRLVDMIITASSKSQLAELTRQQVESQGLEASTEVLNAAVNQAVTITMMSGIVAIVLWLWMARMNHTGRKWARTLGTVFFVIAVFSFLFTLTTPAIGISRVVATLSLLVGLAAIIGMYRQDSSDFYAESSGH